MAERRQHVSVDPKINHVPILETNPEVSVWAALVPWARPISEGGTCEKGGRLRLSNPERISLAEIGKRLGRRALEEVAQIVRPETILGWHRKLIARKFGGSKRRSSAGRATTGQMIEDSMLQLARENRSWGYRRIVGALSNLGHEISHQTVANILKRHGLAPAPEREKKMAWREFIRSHTEVLAAVDFFTAEVRTAGRRMTYYVLTFMRGASRRVADCQVRRRGGSKTGSICGLVSPPAKTATVSDCPPPRRSWR